MPWILVTFFLAFYGVLLGQRWPTRARENLASRSTVDEGHGTIWQRIKSGSSRAFLNVTSKPSWIIAIYAVFMPLAVLVMTGADFPSISFWTIYIAVFLFGGIVWAAWTAGKSLEDAWGPSEEGNGSRLVSTRLLVKGIVLCFVVALLVSFPAAALSRSTLPTVKLTDGAETICGDLVAHLDSFWYLFEGGEGTEQALGVPDGSVDNVAITASTPERPKCRSVSEGSAESQAQFSALQRYLDQMNHLILEKDLLGSEEGNTVFTLAQARTTTTITQLNGELNQAVTRFLSDSGLLREPPLLAKVDLQDAELQKAVLEDANLAGTQLNRADLTDAVLIRSDFSAMKKDGEDIHNITANLTKADLTKAALLGANLSRCTLYEATLTGATLQSADLSSASLQGADLSNAALQSADLSPATVPGFPGLKIPTNLTNANLRHATLQSADLSSADLTDADLTDADLTDANLIEARGLTKEQLSAAKSLKGATMPNGQKYEDWLKSKDREEDGKSEGSS
jgi:uncharacterized protein YjbI with pentapeptide repeats